MKWIDLLALAMVPSVIWIAIDVVRHYTPRIRRRTTWAGEDYLILGVVIAFAGTAIGNTLYWGLNFLARDMHWQAIEQWTYEHGQGANIVTRLIPYLTAGFLHLFAAWVYGVKGVHRPEWYIARSAGLIAVCFTSLVLLVET